MSISQFMKTEESILSPDANENNEYYGSQCDDFSVPFNILLEHQPEIGDLKLLEIDIKIVIEKIRNCMKMFKFSPK